MNPIRPADLDARFTPNNPVYLGVLVGGLILWTVVFTIHYGFGNFTPFKLAQQGIQFENTFEEIGTAIWYGLGFILATFLAIITPGVRTRFILFSLFCLITFGEEANWGQQWLGFASPDFFANKTLFGATSLHEIKWFRPIYLLLFVLLPIGGFLIHLIARTVKKKDFLAPALLKCFVGALFAEFFPAYSIFQFLLAWMVLGYLLLMLHLRLKESTKPVSET